MSAKVLTANRLTDGLAVWLDANGRWTRDLQHALVARHDAAVASLEEIGKRDFSGNLIVDVAVIDVDERADGRIRPLRLRERIRAEGPTIPYAAGYAPAKPEHVEA
ncbi:MAG: nitrite reductase [Rhizobiaceae bacterium]|nr:nitrite reductase [Rhizobiaceae bacterium]